MNNQKQKSSQTMTIILIVVLIGAIAGLIVWGFSGNDKDTQKEDTTKTEQQKEQEETNVEDPTDDTISDDNSIEEDSNANEEDATPTDTVALTDFSTSKQELGESQEEPLYAINSISESSQGMDYHKIIFSTETNTDDTTTQEYPNVVAEYNEDRGGIKITFYDITEDNSGISHHGSKTIDQEGITEIYKEITSEENTVLYTVGVSQETPFKLYSDSTNPNKIVLDVQYPGESEYTLDLGEDNEFSIEKQTLEGARKPDGASVKRFSYSNISGVLTLQFEISGSEDKPIPEVYAEYVDDELHLVFPSLEDHQSDSDRTYSNIPKAGNVQLDVEGDQSTYIIGAGTFTDNEFKLEGSVSPNQIILKIKN